MLSSKSEVLEALQFVETRSNACGKFLVERGKVSDAQYLTYSTYRTNLVSIDQKKLRWLERIDDHYFNTSTEKHFIASKQIISWLDLSKLSPDVTVKDKFITVECTNGDCIPMDERHAFTQPEWNAPKMKDTVRQHYLLCDENSAARIAKALSTAIELAGGKRPKF